MSKSTRITLRAIGALTLFSILFWTFTGLPLWAPTSGDNDPRGLLLFLFHVAGFGALVASFLA